MPIDIGCRYKERLADRSGGVHRERDLFEKRLIGEGPSDLRLKVRGAVHVGVHPWAYLHEGEGPAKGNTRAVSIGANVKNGGADLLFGVMIDKHKPLSRLDR